MGAAHNVVRVLGGSPGGEVWTINPRFYHPSGTPIVEYADLLTWATAINSLNAGAVWPSTLLSLITTTGSIRGIRTEYIDENGDLAQAAEFIRPTAQAGTGTLGKPLQTSLVISLLTGRPGRSYRGRLYLPYWGAPTLQDTGRVAASSRQSIVDAMQVWLTAVGAAAPIGGGLELVVVSQTIGIAARVNQLSIGDVPDTQRRRRDSLVEQRTGVVFPAP